MWWRPSYTLASLERTTSDLLERIQQLERRIECEAQLRRAAVAISAAAQAAPAIGAALEGFAAAMRTAQRRGRAGGVARAALAERLDERWPDGRYMSHEDWEQLEREGAQKRYLRHASGGFTRASSARRFPDGTFAPKDCG
jgi:hypothetical protein